MILDPDFIAIRSGDVTVPLSRLEYIITNRVVKAKGAVVSWYDIMLAAYDFKEPDDALHTVQQTAHRMRKKMTAAGVPMPFSVVTNKGLRIVKEMTL